MEKPEHLSWVDFTKNEYRRVATIQLSIDDLAKDLYIDDHYQEQRQKDEEEELYFDL
ncbi:MAG: hypothetical protein QNJ97_21715 [Myxococcota bacterium]|nr:hypothetical protein [Myxococcota bacterium]